jgi:hypothetical protein
MRAGYLGWLLAEAETGKNNRTEVRKNQWS